VVRVFRFSTLHSLPREFLTLCAGGKYTSKFRKLPRCGWCGWTREDSKGNAAGAGNPRQKAACALQPEVFRIRKLQGVRIKGGMLCQSVHINRGNDAAPRHTDFACA
jgi:hypothetical protein